MDQRTIPQLFENSVARFPNNILMWEKRESSYEGLTYKQMHVLVYKAAAGLMAMGLKRGDHVALISEGRNDWVMSELAILYTGAVNVPVSVKIDELNDLKFRLTHSECRFVIVSKNHLHKIRKIKNDLPDLEKILLLDPVDDSDSDEVSMQEISDIGEQFLRDNIDVFNERWNSLNENNYANICYTSGTTADPKGIILTHRNYTANIEQSTELMTIPESYVSLLILPWDHSFAHTAGIYTLMKNGASMASIKVGGSMMETLKNIPINIKEIKPSFLLSVPSLAKNFRNNIEKGIRAKGEKTEKLFNLALSAAYKYNKEGFNRGSGISKILSPLLKLYDKILFSKIREGFGGRLEFFIGGGALLDIELQKFFYAIGIPMFQGYGLSEAAPVISSNVPALHKLGSSGKPVNNLEIKICDENALELPIGMKGEIVVKGENVMSGYWKNDKATQEVLKNGWLHTGDMGYLDNDGFLFVLGRFKSLLISSDGEKYSPEGIEETITEHSPYLEQMMLHNNQSPYTVALVVPNKEAVLNYLRKKNLTLDTSQGQIEALKLFQSEFNKYKNNGEFSGMFPERWLPSAVAVLGEAFTEENKFMNSTLKMVRSTITEFYKSRIDYMYTAEGRDIFNHQNKTIISRIKD
ncbi:MAG: long-chain fatty acid--CoA ligase [Ignavibacteriae bacterium HGW-Ignavibacteriae-2]|nr:MAG: long-chain fatty acid--CoA ligase [Ignavibacteriae bacterium HGW-Ignavibacteriae-2]